MLKRKMFYVVFWPGCPACGAFGHPFVPAGVNGGMGCGAQCLRPVIRGAATAPALEQLLGGNLGLSSPHRQRHRGGWPALRLTVPVPRSMMDVRDDWADLRVAMPVVIPEYRAAGLAAVLMQETAHRLWVAGGRLVELSLVAETNLRMNRIIELLGATRSQCVRVFRREVGN